MVIGRSFTLARGSAGRGWGLGRWRGRLLRELWPAQ